MRHKENSRRSRFSVQSVQRAPRPAARSGAWEKRAGTGTGMGTGTAIGSGSGLGAKTGKTLYRAAGGRQIARPLRRVSAENAPSQGAWWQLALAYTACTAAAFFTAIVQTGFFMEFRPFHASPDLCLALVTAIFLFFGVRPAAVTAVAGGFFLDALSSDGISLRIFFYLLALGAFWFLRERRRRPIFFTFLLDTAGAAAVHFFLILLKTAVLEPLRLWDTFLKFFLPNVLCTVLFAPLPFLLIWLIAAIRKKNRGENPMRSR
ncbi:MAG: hypothetical protein MSA49_04105 [Clostridia bacterium]|nr:hypothetical protein [Clostridia bacterium]